MCCRTVFTRANSYVGLSAPRLLYHEEIRRSSPAAGVLRANSQQPTTVSHFYINPIFGFTTVAVVAAVLLALLALRPSPQRTSRPRRIALLGLRAAVVLLLLLAMLRPTWIVTEMKKQSATLIVLADRSRSMSVADALAGKSRFDTMRTVLADSEPTLRQLDDDFEIKLYAFAEDAAPIEFDWLTTNAIDLATAPDGRQSAIGAVLEDVLQREAGKRIAGVLLFSDGAWRAYAPHDVPPQTAARRLADLGVPLYTFTFGEARSPEAARDLRIDDLLVNPTVFARNRLDVSASLTVRGYARKTLSVQLSFEDGAGNMPVVATSQLSATADGQTLPIRMSHIPQVAGEHKVTLRVEAQDGELLTTNNEVSTFVTVLAGGVNVLYLEGAVRVEPRFVRRAIDASEDVQVDYEVLQRRTGKFQKGDRFAPGKYDAVILGNVDVAAFEPEDLTALADMVQAGTGLMMIGGYHSFGSGGYSDTPLSALLPVQMNRFERQPRGEPVREDLHWPGPIRMRPAAPLGIAHPIMQIAASEKNLAAWAKLPPLDGANRFRKLTPTAIVLAESDDNRRRPLLVAGQPGAGVRVLAFAGDSTWHWQMKGFGALHRRFWRQVVLWLAHKEEAGGAVWVKLDRRRFGPRQRVPFTVGARGEDGQPVEGVQFKASVEMPDGERHEVSLARRGSQLTGTFAETTQAGDYTVTVSATAAGASLGEVKARFLVFEHDLELDNPAADPALLTDLAQITEDIGGRALVPEELPDLLEKIRQHPPDLEVEHEVRHTYYDRWELFLLFVVIISTEWFLRKRWGLV